MYHWCHDWLCNVGLSTKWLTVHCCLLAHSGTSEYYICFDVCYNAVNTFIFLPGCEIHCMISSFIQFVYLYGITPKIVKYKQNKVRALMVNHVVETKKPASRVRWRHHRHCVTVVTLINNDITGIRQDLAVLMASAVIVLKHETSTLRQSHNFISIDLTFGVGDYVTLPALVWIRWTVETQRGGNIYGSCDFFVVFVFNSSTELQPIPVNQYSHNSSKDAVWYKEDPFWDEKCVVVKFGGVSPKNIPKLGQKGQLPAKVKCRITSKR